MTSQTHRYDMPFGLPGRGGPTSSVWREQVIAEVDQTRFAVERYLDGEDARRIESTLQSACAAAEDRDLRWFGRLRSAFYGASAERAWGAIDAANEALLRDAPPEYVVGQFPRIKRRVQGALDRDDIQRDALEQLTLNDPKQVTDFNREIVVAAFHAANGEERRKYTKVRSFRNMLHVCTALLAVGAIALAVLGFVRPDLALVCFQPTGQAVCPTDVVAVGDPRAPVTGQPSPLTAGDVEALDDRTREAASPVNVLLVELLGLVAAALAAATALRKVRGESTRFSAPLALAFLKLPSGALTAALGLLLMRADFVPGLSALDTPAQIIGWAVIFGYAQELFTQVVDRRAQSVLSFANATADKPGKA